MFSEKLSKQLKDSILLELNNVTTCKHDALIAENCHPMFSLSVSVVSPGSNLFLNIKTGLLHPLYENHLTEFMPFIASSLNCLFFANEKLLKHSSESV